MIQFTIQKNETDMTIKQYLMQKHQFSRRLMTRLTRERSYIRVNDKQRRIDYRLQMNDLLKVTFPVEDIGARMIAEQLPLNIIYEDELFLIINKQPGIAVMPSFNYPAGTIANGVLGYYKKRNLPFTAHIVTRLDRNTSGLMVVAKHHYSHSLFASMIASGTLERRYRALVHGHMHELDGTILASIGRADGSIIKRVVTENGQQAITHYQVIATGDNFSVVDVVLETGRTHQIRVHFAHINHPVIGDDLYGYPDERIVRQALHCHKLHFIHPVTKMPLTFQANLPADMQPILNQGVNFHPISK